MMKLLLPLILLLVGTGGGVGAALFLKPTAPETPPMSDHAANPCGDPPSEETVKEDEIPSPDDDPAEYAKMNNQFVVPIVSEDRVDALMVMSISVEVPPGGKEPILLAEPKLRDAFLQVLFDHANIGGFSGNFTTTSNMRILRNELLAAAQAVVGDAAQDILILDILRQDS